MAGCNPCHVPMEPRFKLSRVSSASQTPWSTGASLACSLPHPHQAGFVLLRRLSVTVHAEPTTKHMAAVKNIVCYVAGTLHPQRAPNRLLPPSGKSCLRQHFAKSTSPFFRQTMQPSLRPLPCSVASQRAGRLLHRLATHRTPSPRRLAASLCPHQEIKREAIPFSANPATCRLRRRRSCPRGRSSSSSSRPRATRPRAAAEVNGSCSSSRSSSYSSRFSSSSPSSLHRRRRRRFCFCCPPAHRSAIGGGLAAEEWILLPLISDLYLFC
ncbi:uncharacterized protein [Triticum aestivum]|uniref:uncharacterized protein n=1 Tax=Triticum aestivum TaxID=4565 RepID=UPI001D01F696|nr:uncharacterized protein LOC123183138 [Triticum aestivum]